jgi:rhomboid protease GluP
MLNEPPNDPRKLHPLERPPAPDPDLEPTEAPAGGRQRVMLHIPIVKPWVTRALIVVNAAIFLLGTLSADLNFALLSAGANNHALVLIDGEYLRLFTSMFLHGSIIHVLMNMYALYLIGANVEGLFGHLRFGLIYLLGGLVGALASAAFSRFSFSVGASGAVFAIFAAEMIYLYRHRKLLGANGRRQLQSLVVVALLNLSVGLLGARTVEGAGIDNWAHVGGFIGGMALTWYLGPYFLPRRHPEHESALTVEDINPLRGRYQTLSLFVAGWLALLIVATLTARG